MFPVNYRHDEARALQPDLPELMGTGPGQNQRGCNGVNHQCSASWRKRKNCISSDLFPCPARCWCPRFLSTQGLCTPARQEGLTASCSLDFKSGEPSMRQLQKDSLFVREMVMSAPAEPAVRHALCRHTLMAAHLGSGMQHIPAHYDLFWLVMVAVSHCNTQEEVFFSLILPFINTFQIVNPMSAVSDCTRYTEHGHCSASLSAACEPTGMHVVCGFQKPVNVCR